MNAMELFRDFKQAVLNEGCKDRTALARLGLLGGEDNALSSMYKLFDGERSWGAWIPGFTILELNEALRLMSQTADAWEWLEERDGHPHFMRGFIPFISSADKISLGPVVFPGHCLNDHVIEYRYESGHLRVWATSTETFFDAFFSLSIAYYAKSMSLAEASTPFDFTARDIGFLSAWREVEFPVRDSGLFNVDEIASE